MTAPGPIQRREVSLFVVVGLAATACNAVVAIAVQKLFGLAPLVASLVGYASAVGISYLGNSLLTFRRPVMHGPQFVRFAAISLAGFAINQTIVYVATAHFRWPLALAEIPVVLIVPPATFLMSKFWAFRAPEPA
jgi:putative flippase GtrA